MEEFNIINERVKDSIHAFLVDTSNNPVSDFNRIRARNPFALAKGSSQLLQIS